MAAPNLSGLVKIRDYLTGAGQKVNWNSQDGVLVNDQKIDTSAMTYSGGAFYARPEQLNAFIPAKVDAPAAFTPNPAIAPLQNDISSFKINPFDPNTSPEFASYKDKYSDAGSQASSDVMGQAAAMSGGRSSSYSSAVASQAKASWDQRLMDVIPTLAAADKARQNENLGRMYDQLNMLQNSDNTAYTRDRNTVADAKVISDDKLSADLSTLGQYSGNYQKEINSRTATPDTSDDYLIPYLKTAREGKISTAATAKAEADEKAANDKLAAAALTRKTFVEDRNYNLDLRNTNSTIANRGARSSGKTSKNTDITTQGTPEQLQLYAGMMDTFSGNGVSNTYKGADGIQKAANWVALHEVDLIGKLGPKLYNTMLARLQKADTVAGAPKTTPEPKVDETAYKSSPNYVGALVDAKNGTFTLADVQASKADIIADNAPNGEAAYRDILNAAIANSTKSTGSSSDGYIR